MTTHEYKILPDPYDRMSDSVSRSFRTDNSFEIKYSKEEEVRMGLFASEVSIYKNGKNLTGGILGKHFWATIPKPFEPLSFDTAYTFIPTCPTATDPRPIILKTSDLKKSFIEFPGYVSANQFSKDNNLLLINGYINLVLHNCDNEHSLIIFTKEDNQSIDFSCFSVDNKKILMLLTDRNTDYQKISTYSLEGKLIEETFLKTPDNIFNFDFAKYESLSKSDSFNLFNTFGYAFVAAGTMLNKWHFLNFDRDIHLITLRTYIPVSEIYSNKEWRQQGCDIRIKEIGLTISTD